MASTNLSQCASVALEGIAGLLHIHADRRNGQSRETWHAASALRSGVDTTQGGEQAGSSKTYERRYVQEVVVGHAFGGHACSGARLVSAGVLSSPGLRTGRQG